MAAGRVGAAAGAAAAFAVTVVEPPELRLSSSMTAMASRRHGIFPSFCVM